MIDILMHALDALPALLATEEGWESLDIDYHPPRVERLFRPHGAGRLYVHRVEPCSPDEALFHPHPWPCAIRVLTGRYEMGMGVGEGMIAPVVGSRLIAEGPLVYEMTDPDAWHYVRPIGAPAYSVMVTGAPWSRPSPRPEQRLRPLSRERASALRRAALEVLTRDRAQRR